LQLIDNSFVVAKAPITNLCLLSGCGTGTCSFICQGISARRRWSDLCGLRVKLSPVTSSLTIQR